MAEPGNDSLFGLFAAEASEHLRTLSRLLLVLERNPADRDPVREMFLAAHTLKGSSAMLGLDALATLAHALEDVLQLIRDPDEAFDSEAADLIFRALDVAATLTQGVHGADAPPNDAYAVLLQALQQRGLGPRTAHLAAAESCPHVLLIEDSATVRLLESDALSEAGFSVSQADAAAAAMTSLRAQSHALVIVGHQLRDRPGLDLVTALRGLDGYQATPVVLTCAQTYPGDSEAIQSLGVRVFLREGVSAQGRLVELARALTANDAPRAGD